MRRIILSVRANRTVFKCACHASIFSSEGLTAQLLETAVYRLSFVYLLVKEPINSSILSGFIFHKLLTLNIRLNHLISIIWGVLFKK